MDTFSYDVETEPEFSFRKILEDFGNNIINAFRQWKLMLVFIVTGAVLGTIYAIFKTKTFTAQLSFVVEDAKTSGGSLASAVAGQLGVDLGGLTGGSGILAGDNLLELLKSSSFIKKTLLTPYSDSADNKITLADRYAEQYHLKSKWAHSEDVGRTVNFYATRNKVSRLEDSLLQVLILRITEKELNISKPDKKLNIFSIEITMRDEKLAQLFCERLLNITTGFYVDTKIGRLKRNVERLQKRADTIGFLLNRQTYASSSENSKLIDLNPVYSTSAVNAEITARDKLVLSTIYTEVVKNLEISKTALIQETPTVEIIDNPDLPLIVNRIKWYAGMIGGAITGFLAIFLWISVFRRKREEVSL